MIVWLSFQKLNCRSLYYRCCNGAGSNAVLTIDNRFRDRKLHKTIISRMIPKPTRLVTDPVIEERKKRKSKLIIINSYEGE
jgi:hypothetical protein